MKNASPALLSFLGSPPKLAWCADLYTVTLINGNVYRWTTCDTNLIVNGQTWQSGGIVLRRGNTRQTSKLEIDTIDIELNGAANVPALGTLATAIVNGSFDYARVKIDRLVGAYPGDQSLGLVSAWFEGRWAGSDMTGHSVTLHVESELAALNVPVPRFAMQAACMNAVYDANCGLTKALDNGTGNGTGAPWLSFTSTDAAIVARGSGYYNLGVFNTTSGVVGARRAIQSFTVTGGTAMFVAYLPAAAVFAGGSFTFVVYPGCPRTMAACAAFPNAVGSTSNLVNFRGFPYVPRPETGH